MIVFLSPLCLFSLCFQLLLGTEAFVGMADFHQFMRGFPVIISIGRLKIRTFVPGYSKPVEPIYDAVIGDRLGSKPFDTVSSMLNFIPRVVKLGANARSAWFSEQFDLFMLAQGDPVSLEGLRLTGGLEKRGDAWVIVQLHTSVPVPGQAAEY